MSNHPPFNFQQYRSVYHWFYGSLIPFRQSHRLSMYFVSATYFQPPCHPVSRLCHQSVLFPVLQYFSPDFSQESVLNQYLLLLNRYWTPLRNSGRCYTSNYRSNIMVVLFDHLSGMGLETLLLLKEHQYLFMALTVIINKHPTVKAEKSNISICIWHCLSNSFLNVRLSLGLQVKFLRSR